MLDGTYCDLLISKLLTRSEALCSTTTAIDVGATLCVRPTSRARTHCIALHVRQTGTKRTHCIALHVRQTNITRTHCIALHVRQTGRHFLRVFCSSSAWLSNLSCSSPSSSSRLLDPPDPTGSGARAGIGVDEGGLVRCTCIGKDKGGLVRCTCIGKDKGGLVRCTCIGVEENGLVRIRVSCTALLRDSWGRRLPIRLGGSPTAGAGAGGEGGGGAVRHR